MTSSAIPIVVYFNGTFVNRENGAHVRVWDQITWLSETYPKVILYSFSDHPDCPWRDREVRRFGELFPKVELAIEGRSGRLRAMTRLKNAAMTLAPESLRGMLGWRAQGASPVYERLVARRPHLLFVNYVDALTELNGVDLESCIVETHDIKFLVHAKRRGRSLANLRTLGKFRSEAFQLGQAAGLIAIAPPEAAMFKLWYPDKPVFYIPQYPQPLVRASAAQPFEHDLLFVGSEHHFNVEGLIRFLQGNDWASGYRLGVAGKICGVDSVKDAAARCANVGLMGFVDDIGELYSKSKAVLCPVDGTGLKIKVIEALAAGKPVLASEHTMNGLPPGYEGCVFPLTQEAARRLTSDDQALAAAGVRALRYAATLSSAGQLAELEAFIDRRLSAG